MICLIVTEKFSRKNKENDNVQCRLICGNFDGFCQTFHVQEISRQGMYIEYQNILKNFNYLLPYLPADLPADTVTQYFCADCHV